MVIRRHLTSHGTAKLGTLGELVRLAGLADLDSDQQCVLHIQSCQVVHQHIPNHVLALKPCQTSNSQARTV